MFLKEMGTDYFLKFTLLDILLLQVLISYHVHDTLSSLSEVALQGMEQVCCIFADLSNGSRYIGPQGIHYTSWMLTTGT